MERSAEGWSGRRKRGGVSLTTQLLAASSSLEEGFTNPPVSAKPWVYWSWMNGNVTEEGITADLEAMQRVGIGGALVINLSLAIPEGPVAPYMGPEWRRLLVFAAAEADRLGMEMAIYTCDGWQLAGGPWITPETAMKKVVSTEMQVQGPGPLETILTQPPTNRDYYRDIAVLAFPTPGGGRVNGSESGVKVTSSIADGDVRALVDGDPTTLATVPRSLEGQQQFIQFCFPEPRDVHAIVFHIPTDGLGAGIADSRATTAELQVSYDGQHYRTVGSFEIDWERQRYGTSTVTVGCDPQTSRYFRLVIANARAFDLGEVELLAEPRVHYWEAKAGMARKRQHGGETFAFRSSSGPGVAQYPSNTIIRPETIVDLTDRMGADGHLDWEMPAGDWTILRVGFTATGACNSPATRGGRGLECDKLSPKGIEALFPHVVGAAMKDLNALPGKVMKYVHSDSWEVGEQNWTEELPAEFRKRRGYDLLPFLIVMASGRIVDSYEVSERFLRDYRRTIADLIADGYHKRLQELCHEVGLGYESEACGRQQYMYDALGYFAQADVPMGEFWLGPELCDGVRVDCRAAASVAHTYGKRYVAAEAFTSHWRHARWANDPYALKALGDKAFCTGVNRFVFHRYAHQPYNEKPGLTYGPWGIHFERTNTWWEQGKGWVTYLGRCQWMLQQGEFVADVMHYIGDEIPNYLGHREELWSPVPPGYDYDGCNTEILLQLQVENGNIVLPNGMQYRLLLLPDSKSMLPKALRKVRELVDAGATVVGPKPLRSPSLEDYPECDAEVARLADELWGDCDGLEVKENRLGAGRVVHGRSLTEILAEMRVAPDFTYDATSAEAEIHYIHRRVGDADIYFVANGRDRAEDALCTFRVEGKQPELWCPETGTLESMPTHRAVPGGIQLPLHLTPRGSAFVVFRYPIKHATGHSPAVQVDQAEERMEITGPWELSFPPDWGAPEQVVLDELVSWSEHEHPGVRYFSGTATYAKEINIPASLLREQRVILLDLGRVKNLAEVEVNGQSLGVLWKPPFQVNVTSALKPGANRLAISITNLWPNRLIGDEQLPDDVELRDPDTRPTPIMSWPAWMTKGERRKSGRYTLVTWRHYTKDSPLLESGLLGPVFLHVVRRVVVTWDPRFSE